MSMCYYNIMYFFNFSVWDTTTQTLVPRLVTKGKLFKTSTNFSVVVCCFVCIFLPYGSGIKTPGQPYISLYSHSGMNRLKAILPLYHVISKMSVVVFRLIRQREQKKWSSRKLWAGPARTHHFHLHPTRDNVTPWKHPSITIHFPMGQSRKHLLAAITPNPSLIFNLELITMGW